MGASTTAIQQECVIGSIEWYLSLWESLVLLEDPYFKTDLSVTVHLISLNKHRYTFVQRETGVPWALIAGLHYRERSLCFNSCLHNGDPLGKITTHVPHGRGPFFTFEQSAIDALELLGLSNAPSWTLALMLKHAEGFNGLGYLKHHCECLSPYLWTGTNHAGLGKYSADGHFDAKLKDRQLGVATIFKGLINEGLLNPDDLYA